MVSKEEILQLIEHLEKPLAFYEDPVYTKQEKNDIKEFEELVIGFYNDLKKDQHIEMRIPEQETGEDKRIVWFTKVTMDISNKLVQTKEFNAEEGLFILLSLYCLYCEMIKNLLLHITFKIYRSLKGEEWNRGFMMLGRFIGTMKEYKNGKYSALFSDIDVDLRNSFVHGKINFPNNEVEYYDSENIKKSLKLSDFLSKYKKLPPLYTTFFAYRMKIFVDEIKDYATKRGFL